MLIKYLDKERNNGDSKLDSNNVAIHNFLPWFIKYVPRSFNDLVVTREIKELIDSIESYKKGKGILLYGDPGCGKTTAVTLIAREKNFELIEVNASDTRNKASIQEVVGNSIKQRSLFATSKIILIDEVDGISGREDRGGVAEIVRIIKTSLYPIVLTANSIEDDKLRPIIKVCKLVNFNKSTPQILLKIGERILKSEGIEYEKKDLEKFIKERNISDIRAFINDLQASIEDNKFNPGLLDYERSYKKVIRNLLENIFMKEPEVAYALNQNTTVSLDDLMLYLEENIPHVTKRLFQPFNILSKADVFRGRIIKWQYWRYLVYINFYLNYGISAVVSASKVSSKRNTRILKKWIYNNQASPLKSRTKLQKERNEEETFIEKLSRIYRCSTHKARRQLGYFCYIYRNSKDFRECMRRELEIDEKTDKFLKSY